MSSGSVDLGSTFGSGGGGGGVTSLNSLTGSITLIPGTGIVITPSGSTIEISSTNSGGTVTSVALTAPSSVITVTGSPITSSGTIALTFHTQSANTVFAGPTTGSAAAPTFRALVAADIPSLGYVSSVALVDSTGTFNITGSPITSSGTFTLANFNSQSDSNFLAAPTGSPGDPSFRVIAAADVPTLNQNTTGTAANITATSNSTLTSLPNLSLPTSQLSGDISLTAQVSGILPIANGGTNASTPSTGFNNLSPLTNAGDLLYENATPSGARLPIGTTGQVLTVVGGLPAWQTVAGTGSVTSVSVVTSNGFAGTVANPTTTPAITLSCTVTGILQANGTTISAASTTGSGNIVLATSPTLVSPALGTPSAIILTNGTGLPLTTGVSGTLPIANGGTNATTAASGFNNLSPLTTTGDIIYEVSSGVAGRLGIGTSGQVLTVSAGVPSWSTPATSVTTIGTIDTQTASSNGLVISGSSLYAQSASSTNPGMVNNTTQTFSGSKTLGSAASDKTTIGAASSTALHQVNGGMNRTTRTITTNLTIDTTTTDFIIFCNQSAGITLTLPSPTNGRILIIKDISGTANTNNITVAQHASETIEGIAASKILQSNWGSWTFTSDGTNWYMI